MHIPTLVTPISFGSSLPNPIHIWFFTQFLLPAFRNTDGTLEYIFNFIPLISNCRQANRITDGATSLSGRRSVIVNLHPSNKTSDKIEHQKK